MPELNQRIAHWRSALHDLSESQADELEDHLRQQHAELIRLGLSDEEALAVAAMRCGRPGALADEFDRAEPAAAWSRRLRWMVVGFLGCALMNGLVLLENNALGALMLAFGLPLWLTIMLRIFSLTLLIALVVWTWHWWMRREPDALWAEPPAWLTSGWTLSAWVALMPWLSMAGVLLNGLIGQALTNAQQQSHAISTQVTWYMLPFVAPMILLIIAISVVHKPKTA